MNKSIYGYDLIGGKLVPNEFESEIVKWISATTLAYIEHPPVCLVEAVIMKYQVLYKEELKYEDAEKKVLYSQILEYITNELNMRSFLHERKGSGKDVSELKAVLSLPYDEVKSSAAECLKDSERTMIWAKRVRRVHNNNVYAGTLTMHEHGAKKEPPKTIEIQEHHEAIVPKDLFEAVQKKKYGNASLDDQKSIARQRAAECGFVVLGDNEIVDAGGALCDVCGQRKLIADGCSCSTVKCNEKKYKRIRFGEEEFEHVENCCHDCGTRRGHFHHSGCDVEECPVCGGQLLGCDCEIEFITED